MTQTWFITGSSRGFGRALARAALEAGDRVAATARRPEQLDDLATAYPDRFQALALDVTDVAAAGAAISEARQRFGRLDVIVNNAGYANLSPIETGHDEDFRAQFETNFWGVYNVSKAAIPVLKEQGGGLIMQFSSMGGRVGGSPGIASYQAAKFAIDGFSRVLRTETAPFGIKVIVVEPSGFRTDWAGSSMTVRPIPEDPDARRISRRTRVNPNSATSWTRFDRRRPRLPTATSPTSPTTDGAAGRRHCYRRSPLRPSSPGSTPAAPTPIKQRGVSVRSSTP
jgi:NAD(P)-dependent dehydrogenase (short-subunit alcohol dehydrogenase family)